MKRRKFIENTHKNSDSLFKTLLQIFLVIVVSSGVFALFETYNAFHTLPADEKIVSFTTVLPLLFLLGLCFLTWVFYQKWKKFLLELNTHKLAEERLRQLEQAVDIMQIGITISDLDGKIFYTNLAEADLHGYQREELLGKDVGSLAPPELRKPPTLDQIKRWKGLIRESVNVRKDGSSFPVWLMSEVVKNPDGEPCAIVTSCEDITERKVIEEERRQYRDQLEDLVKERTLELSEINTQLQQAKETAESANRAKSEFLANMSHELRTPLNGILGYTQILRPDMSLTERQREAIEVIHRSGEHLLMMINDILDLSKIEAGKVELELTEFYLPDFLKTIVEIARIRAQQQGISFDYNANPDLPRGVYGDEKRLRQVLLNLLSNAIKFTEQGSVILRVGAGSPRPKEGEETLPLQSTIRFEVEDTGVGIPPEQLGNIFSAFHQVRNMRVHSEGTGLGLAISQRLVRMMGGEIHVQSTVGQGSSFWFEVALPVIHDYRFVTDVLSTHTHILSFRGKKRTVLIADDHATNRAVLQDMLRPLGFDIFEAIDGSDTLEKAATYHPDLILIDLVMPVMDGIEAIRQLRMLPEFKNVVVIAVSASVSDQKKQQSLTAGCDAFLEKPFRVQELLELIRIHLKLDWIYASHSEEQQLAPHLQREDQISDEPLIPPSQEELTVLYKMAMSGRLTKLRKQIKAIEEKDLKFSPFTRKLRRLIKEFRIQQIQQFIEQYMEEKA